MVGFSLGLGTTRLYLLSDWTLLSLWVTARPAIPVTRQTVVFLSLFLLPFSISFVLAPTDTGILVLRIVSFGLVIPQLVKTRSYLAIEFWLGLTVPMLGHGILIALQLTHVLSYVQGPHGFTYNSSLMAAIGFALLPSFPFGGVGFLVFTVSRTYTAATALVAILYNRKWLALPVTGSLLVLFILTPSRCNPTTEIHNRLELATPTAHWDWYGTGF